MPKKYVKFNSDKRGNYLAEGDLDVGICPNGGAGIELMCGDIPREKIIGFEIDTSRFPPILYFKWKPSKGFVRTEVGKIQDLEEALRWVEKVNKSNRW